jgi:predicted DNA-binding transcriptional regulator AlpA
MQAILKQIGGQRTEQENLQIIQQVRALKLSREDLYAFLNDGELPPLLAGALGEKATEPEKIYSRRERKRNSSPDTLQTETPESESANFESEEMKNEN